MSDSQKPQANDNTQKPELDPEIEAILHFEPVPRRFKKEEGWTAPLQKLFIAHLARTGSPGKACDALGKRRSGIDKLYKVAGAESFRAAWAKAVEIAERRQAERIEAEHRATAGLTPPFVDNRRKAAFAPAAEEPEISDEQKWELIHNIGIRFMRKVAAEREARLAGEIVAADFYLRQITFMEVLFDLSSESMGWNAAEALRELRRGEHDLMQIVSTPIADWMDAARREWWAREGEPERPPHPDVRFLEHHSTADGEYSTDIDQHSYGALTPPARGYTAEEWEGMSTKEQMLARQAQLQQDAAEQVEWEAKARREYDDRRANDRSA